MVSIVGLYIDLHDAIKEGRVGKITTLLRLLLPYFAGSSSHKYTREIVNFLTMEECCDPDTWRFILDNTLIKAKGHGFIEADCRMEHLVRIQKRHLKNKSPDFELMSSNWSLVSGILDCARRALKISTSNHDKEIIKSHNRKSMAIDILSLSSAIIDDGIISDPNKGSEVPTLDLYRKGTSKLHSFDLMDIYNDCFGVSSLSGGAGPGNDLEDPFAVDTDTTDVIGAHEEDEDIVLPEE